MTISIQSSTAALTALETLSAQTNGVSDPNAAPSALGDTPASADAGASIIDLSGGAPTSGGASRDLASSASIADAAVAAGGAIQTLLTQLQQDAVTASDPNLSADDRAALDSGFKSGLAQIHAAVSGASLDGVNLIDGSVSVQASTGGGVTLTGTDLSPTGPLIGLAAGAGLTDPSGAAAIADQLGTAIDNVGQAVGQIAAQSQAISDHLTLVAQASDSQTVAGRVDGGLDSDGARLLALQVQQQLQGAGASIANQAPQSILSLFR